MQRRLETGLDLTQAELRALQREASFQPDQAEHSEKTVTAVEDPLSFLLPPTRPLEMGLGEIWREEATSEQSPDEAGKGSGSGNMIASSRTPVSEDGLSTSGEELRTAVNEIFANEGFSFETESIDSEPNNVNTQPTEASQQWDAEEWQNEREVLFPNQESSPPDESPGEIEFADQRESPERTRAPDEIDSADEGERPWVSELPTPEPVSREETLVLFLLQVPGGGLRAKFSSAQEADSPFGGQLKLYSKVNEAGALPGEASEFTVNLPPEGLVRLSTGRVGNNGHEWALITLDEEAQACATFDLRAGRNLRSTAAVFSKSPSRKSSVPLKTSRFEDNGFVLANPTERPVAVKLTLVDEQGNEVSSAISQELDPLPAGKQVAIFAKNVFRKVPDIMDFKGRLIAEVSGEGLIWTAGLSQNDGALSFLPVAEMRKSSEA